MTDYVPDHIDEMDEDDLRLHYRAALVREAARNLEIKSIQADLSARIKDIMSLGRGINSRQVLLVRSNEICRDLIAHLENFDNLSCPEDWVIWMKAKEILIKKVKS